MSEIVRRMLKNVIKCRIMSKDLFSWIKSLLWFHQNVRKLPKMPENDRKIPKITKKKANFKILPLRCFAIKAHFRGPCFFTRSTTLKCFFKILKYLNQLTDRLLLLSKVLWRDQVEDDFSIWRGIGHPCGRAASRKSRSSRSPEKLLYWSRDT